MRRAEHDDNAKNETAKTTSSQGGHVMVDDDMEDGEVDEGDDLGAGEQATECLEKHVPIEVCCISYLD